MNFLSHQSHDSLVTEAATPLLKLLSTVDNLEIFDELETDIQELISTIDPVLKAENYIRANALESLELLSNFCLIDQALELILKNNVSKALSNLLQHETSQNEEFLLEKGELSNNDKIISSSLAFLNLLLNSPKTIISNETCLKFQENVIIVIKSQNYIPNQIKEAIKTLRILLKKKINVDFIIEQCVKNGLIDALIENLERYKENAEITQEINSFLLDATKQSNLIAGVLSEKDFIKILIKETRSLFKQYLINENTDYIIRLKENINCIRIFAVLGELSTIKNYQTICLELCFAIISKGVEKEEDEIKNFQGKKENLTKQIRLFPKETQTFVYPLNEVLQDIMNLCLALTQYKDLDEIWHRKENRKLYLKIIELFFKNQEIIYYVLELIAIIMTSDFQEFLISNNYFQIFSLPLNYFPLDSKIEVRIGAILQVLNPQIYSKHLECFSTDNMKKEENSCIELANSLVVYTQTNKKIAITQAEINKTEEIINKISDDFHNMRSFIGSTLIFIGRASNLGERIKTFLLKNSLVKQIIETMSEFSNENIILLEIFLHVLNKIFKLPQNLSTKIDPSTWDYLENKPSFILTEAISDIYVSNQGKNLNYVVSCAENKGEDFLRINHEALELLFNCAFLHPQIAAFLTETHGLAKMQELYEDICKRSIGYNENLLVNKLCKLICAMSRIQSCFDEVLKKTSFLPILLTSISNISISDSITLENCDFYDEFIWCLGVLTDNNFDKAELIEKKLLEIYFEILTGFVNSNFFKVAEQNERFGQIFVQTLNTLKILEKDPSFSKRICSDLTKLEVFKKIFHSSLNENSQTIDLEKISDGSLEEVNLDAIESSENIKERIIENILNTLLELTKNPMILDKFDFEENSMLDKTICLICEYKHNLIIVVRGMKLIENMMKSFNERELLSNLHQDHPKIKKIQEFLGKYYEFYILKLHLDKIEKFFGKLSYLMSIVSSLKLLISGKVTKTSEIINSEISQNIGVFAGVGKYLSLNNQASLLF